jgi:hypothetical protein
LAEVEAAAILRIGVVLRPTTGRYKTEAGKVGWERRLLGKKTTGQEAGVERRGGERRYII